MKLFVRTVYNDYPGYGIIPLLSENSVAPGCTKEFTPDCVLSRTRTTLPEIVSGSPFPPQFFAPAAQKYQYHAREGPAERT